MRPSLIAPFSLKDLHYSRILFGKGRVHLAILIDAAAGKWLGLIPNRIAAKSRRTNQMRGCGHERIDKLQTSQRYERMKDDRLKRRKEHPWLLNIRNALIGYDQTTKRTKQCRCKMLIYRRKSWDLLLSIFLVWDIMTQPLSDPHHLCWYDDDILSMTKFSRKRISKDTTEEE